MAALTRADRYGLRDVETSRRRLWPSIHRVSVFTPDDCRKILALGESLEGWQDALVRHRGGRVLRPKKRLALQIHVAGDEADARVRAAFAPHVAKVERAVRDLDQRYFGLGVGAIQDAQLVRYPEGGITIGTPMRAIMISASCRRSAT